jgi:hypothetical protein
MRHEPHFCTLQASGKKKKLHVKADRKDIFVAFSYPSGGLQVQVSDLVIQEKILSQLAEYTLNPIDCGHPEWMSHHINSLIQDLTNLNSKKQCYPNN